MKGCKISAEEFIRNYTNVRLDEINAPIKPQVTPEIIYNPITIYYSKIIKQTDKALLFEFEDGTEYWFPKAYTRIDKKRKHLTIPKKFTKETALLDFKIAGSI